jgi:hypothetical protein
LPVLRAHAFALSGDGPMAYDDAIIAAVKLQRSAAGQETTNKSNTEGEKP